MGFFKLSTSSRSRIKRAVFQTVLAWSYYHLFTEHVYEIGLCNGASMEPTLSTNNIVLIKKTDKYEIKRGDIVVLRSPLNPYKYLCKRTVYLSDDMIVSSTFSGRIPRGFSWFEGDNPARSTDSRNYGPVPNGLIVGKAVYTLWPVVKGL